MDLLRCGLIMTMLQGCAVIPFPVSLGLCPAAEALTDKVLEEVLKDEDD